MNESGDISDMLEQSSRIDEYEYEILLNWYREWVHICRLLTTFSFAAIGFTMVVLDIKGDQQILKEQIELIKISWGFLAAGGLLAAVSITLAYMWLDSFSRARMPSLVGKVVFKRPFKGTLKVGVGGWVVSLAAAASTLVGLYFFILAAWVAL